MNEVLFFGKQEMGNWTFKSTGVSFFFFFPYNNISANKLLRPGFKFLHVGLEIKIASILPPSKNTCVEAENPIKHVKIYML